MSYIFFTSDVFLLSLNICNLCIGENSFNGALNIIEITISENEVYSIATETSASSKLEIFIESYNILKKAGK